MDSLEVDFLEVVDVVVLAVDWMPVGYNHDHRDVGVEPMVGVVFHQSFYHLLRLYYCYS
jgi:hypothetical protein